MLANNGSEQPRQTQANKLRHRSQAIALAVHAGAGILGTITAAIAGLHLPVAYGAAAMVVTAIGYTLAVLQCRRQILVALDAAEAWEARYYRFGAAQTAIAEEQRKMAARQILAMQSYRDGTTVRSAW